MRLLNVAIASLAILSGCAQANGRPSAALESVLIEDVPHVKQKPDFCGEACAAMYLEKLGNETDQDHVFDASGLDPSLGRGCFTAELRSALGNVGFDVGAVWYRVDASKAEGELESRFAEMHADLKDGVPSIVCMHYDDSPRTTEHFRLVLGYDAEKDEVIYHEPAVADGAYQRMARRRFLDLWPLKYDSKRWTVIRFRLAEKKLRPASPSRRFTAADYAQHVMQLRKKLPGGHFTVVVEPPFVVVGDEPPSSVRRRSKQTVRWATRLLKKDFFDRDPNEILDIWLFKDDTSYRKHARSLFGDEPSTPYGYYSPDSRALVMNISTGGGTLVHEIVHPFMASNFPECPSWLNEGLGSLYEQSAERGGHIRGLTNWRLAGLQEAIRAGEVPSFKKLTSSGNSGFYRRDPGTNYAQARYLCYYLQEKGLLVKFYQRFRKAHEDDPTGYETLQEVLGEEDMDAFKKKWEAFVLKLRF